MTQVELTSANLATWNASQFRLELPRTDDATRLKAVAVEFESLFVKQMLDSMRSTLRPQEGLFYGGLAEDFFEDMLYEEYARIIARTGRIGIADLIVRQYEQSTVAIE